jgi:hypothetical protein
VGPHTVTLTVTDNDNAAHSNETTVTVNSGPINTPPNGVIDSPADNQTIYRGESVYFSGTGIDPDGDTLLSYRWQDGSGSGIGDHTIGPWVSVCSGTFSNGANVKSVSFPVTTGRYIRLLAYNEAKRGPWTSALEIGVTGTPR